MTQIRLLSKDKVLQHHPLKGAGIGYQAGIQHMDG